MKRYTTTTSSMKDQKLPLTRRHFVASSAITPLALGAVASLGFPTLAMADVMTVLEDDNILGDPKAPIGIVEYASLTCPHCAYFHKESFKSIKTDLVDTGKAFIIYRDFPLDRYAFQASVLAHAGGKDKFFAILEILFKKQEEWRNASNPTEALIKIGRQVGISQAKFEENLKNEELGERILMDRMVGANEYNVSSTPTLFINGEQYDGDKEVDILLPYLKGL